MSSNKQQHVEKKVAVTPLEPAASSLISKLELPPGGRVTPPAIVTVNTRYVQRPSNAMAGDHDIDRKQRVLILMSDTGGGHRASAEVGQVVSNYRYRSFLPFSRRGFHLTAWRAIGCFPFVRLYVLVLPCPVPVTFGAARKLIAAVLYPAVG